MFVLRFLFIAALSASSLVAGVVGVEVESSEKVMDGRAWGEVGAYELVRGRIRFAFDPANPANRRIADIHLAERQSDGMVHADANFVVLRPAEPARGSGVALVEVSNRGGMFSLNYYNRATSRELTADNAEAFGDGLLMRQGMTVIWVGWQHDVPERDGVLRLNVPISRDVDGGVLSGLVRADWVLDEPATVLGLGHRNHKPYQPVADDHADHVLTYRLDRDAPRVVVARDQWRFVTGAGERVEAIEAARFEAGRIYELVYRAKDPVPTGLGLAALRDVISYAKYDARSPFAAKQGLAAGVSQTGRWLRTFLYHGMNVDEAGRKAFDGLMIITAGAGRGSFNHRFAQPSRDGHQFSAFQYPTDIFPFTSVVQTDPISNRADGILAKLPPAMQPKIFQINSGYEYWGRAAALIHTDASGVRDVASPANERIYHLASGQHFVDRFPPANERKIAEAQAWVGNPLEIKVNYRALLLRLADWVAKGQTPPASAIPRLNHGELVDLAAYTFPAIPGLKAPRVAQTAYRADYGPRWHEGVVTTQPPRLGPTFPTLVPAVDAFGNERGGVRNVEIRVPLATYTPWSLRGASGLPVPHALNDFRGMVIPLPKAERKDDPRPAIRALYGDRDVYLGKVREAAAALVGEGFLLAEDQAYVIDRAGQMWDFVTAEKD